jgi:penicillin-binding protein 1A
MSEHERTSTISADAPTGGATVVDFPRTREKRRFRPKLWRRRKRPKRFKIRKLRVLLVLFFLGILAVVSALFGMFMAVASDLPHLQRPTHTPTTILDRRGNPIGTLTGSERRIYLNETEIAPVMKHAIISIEDRRFYTNSGVDLRGIARAAVEDVTSGQAVQGASTIPQQFVKLSLAAENERTVFQKLREAALAYHLTRRWSKEEILRNYLNQIYFGNGAYGVESAARTYFSYNHDKCGGRGKDEPPCASVLLPHEAALLAAMVASPSAFDPIQHPVAAKRRRDIVLLRMLQQGYLTPGLYATEKAEPLPTRDDLNFPEEDTEFPYFTSWIKPQVVDRLGGGQQGAQRAFEGGLKVKTTIDSRVQRAAEKAIKDWLPGPSGPRASLVAIANNTGEVRAMVGGDNYGSRPFNLATQGQRQPGSSFKPFVLAEALRQNISPQSTWESKKKTYIPKGGEKFTVNNYEDSYSGVMTLANATTFSDNAVYAQVGMKVKPKKVAKLARRMGVRTPVSSNAAMALGGLHEGVTPLDMAHAYETFATGGKLIYGSLSPGQSGKSLPVPGPVGIERIDKPDGKKDRAVVLDDGQRMVNKRRTRKVLTPEVAGTVSSILQTVVKNGTGTRAQIPNVMVAGKTGTTEDYGDAWFVAWTKEYTVAVWVGYPDEFKPMKSEFQGEPVAGGTYPAAIWKTFMQALLKIDPLPKKEGGDGTGKPIETPTPGAGTYTPPTATVAPPTATTAPPTTTNPGTGGTGGTTPPATDPPATDPPATDPPATDPPATDPGATDPGTGGAGGTAPPAADGTTG